LHSSTLGNDIVAKNVCLRVIPQQAERACDKLARTFAAQVAALKDYRSKGEQKMAAQHVPVAEGASDSRRRQCTRRGGGTGEQGLHRRIARGGHLTNPALAGNRRGQPASYTMPRGTIAPPEASSFKS